ncbi:hypothetical protein EC572_07875 [Helicobacter pylori]|nr:hypothetical protein EC572_07875 [Helicobacter pylori]
MVECHFYPFFKKNMTRGIVSSGIQSMVNDAFYSNSMMRFILIYLKLYFTTPPFPSFLMIFIHFFQTLKFLSNPKNFKQTLSIACL